MAKLETLIHYLDLATTSKKHAYIGWVGHKNLGDEILFDAHKALFDSQNLKFYLRSKMLDKVLPFAQNFNGAFLGGGTLINQANQWLVHIAELQAKGVPFACFGTGVACREFWQSNPSWGWQDNMEAWAEVLKSFHFVGVRGPRSQKYLSQYGVNAEVVGDTALTLAPNDSVYRSVSTKPVIGVNVGYAKDKMWGNEGQFGEYAIKMVKSLLEAGYHVKLLPVWDRDMPINKKIMERFGSESISMVTAFEDYQLYTNEVTQCDVFIGEKLHATIIATMHRIPSIMLEYRPKCLEYMLSIGMERFTVKTSNMDIDLILGKVQVLLENHKQMTEELEDAVMHYKTLQYDRAHSLAASNWNSKFKPAFG